MPLNTIVTDFVESHGYSLSSNGYYKLPGGLTIQWGSAAGVATDGNLAVTFPIAFSSQCLQVYACPSLTGVSGVTGPSYGVGLVTNTGFTIYNEGYAASGSRFLAVGV